MILLNLLKYQFQLTTQTSSKENETEKIYLISYLTETNKRFLSERMVRIVKGDVLGGKLSIFGALPQ